MEFNETHPYHEKLRVLLEQQCMYLNPHLVINDVAKAIGTNRTYLSEFINREMRMTFTEYVNTLRLAHAEKLMASNPSMHLDIVSEESGFNSRTTFRRVFLNKHGVTPAQFRKLSKSKL